MATASSSAPARQCDEGAGNNNNAAPGTLACTLPACGDGFAQPGEGCDDADLLQTNDCLNHCQLPTCGDGYKWLGHEECDDANAVEGDGRHECQAAARRVFATSTTYDGNLGGLGAPRRSARSPRLPGGTTLGLRPPNQKLLEYILSS